MDGRSAVAVPCPLQIGCHAAVAVYSMIAVVDVPALLLNLRFFRMRLLDNQIFNKL